MPSNTQIKAESLPDGSQPEMNFLESSFFTNNMSNRSFPSPTQVRALSEPTRATQPSPVIFEDLNLLVKFGPYVTTNEAQCLWAIRNILGDAVPVPEVYGWRVDGDEVFIYMELIRGDTLLSRWDSMNTEDKDIVCKDLSRIMTSLRSIGQISYQPFVGSLSGHHLLDYVLEGFPPGGPFPSIKDFNDWFASLAWSRFPDPASIQDPWRESLPDTGSIKFTHGDLHRGNIIVSSTPPRVIAIVDWAHGGWYPDWWEFCKAAYTCSYDEEWRTTWILKFLERRDEVHNVWGEYIHAMGAV